VTRSGRDPRALGGIVGPAAFTTAWIVCTANRRNGYTVTREHLSGLAAPDAWRPEIMISGFLGLGIGTYLFGAALEDALGGARRAGPGPWLIKTAGIATLAAGLLRRDHQLLPPLDGIEEQSALVEARRATRGKARRRAAGQRDRSAKPLRKQSWKNDGHDIASGVIYACLGAAPLFLAHRFRDDPEWSPLRRPAIGSAMASGAVVALFATRVVEPWNGIVQRVAVTLPMTAMGAMATALLRRRPRN
jgi:Protein of unknown function (DUF998)